MGAWLFFGWWVFLLVTMLLFHDKSCMCYTWMSYYFLFILSSRLLLGTCSVDRAKWPSFVTARFLECLSVEKFILFSSGSNSGKCRHSHHCSKMVKQELKHSTLLCLPQEDYSYPITTLETVDDWTKENLFSNQLKPMQQTAFEKHKKIDDAENLFIQKGGGIQGQC